VLVTAGVRVTVREEQPPPVRRGLRHQLLHPDAVGHMEGQVVEAGAVPVVPEGRPGG